MKIFRFWKIPLAIALVLALNYIAHGIDFDMNSESNVDDSKQRSKAMTNGADYTSPIFSVHFLEQMKNKQFSGNLSSSLTNGDFDSLSILSDINHKVKGSLLEGLDSNMVEPGQIGNPESFDGEPSLIIDDALYYTKESTSGEEKKDDGETIFVTDNANSEKLGQLASCSKYNGKYKCHTAVHNLFYPQKILALNNRLYIVNMHNGRESGDITVCRIRDSGRIDSCVAQIIPIKSPALLHYEDSKLYISSLVYAGDKKYPTVLACSLDGNGNIIYSSCVYDSSLEKMKFISTYYNGFYYRPHAFETAKYIDKCAQISDDECASLTNDKFDNPLSLILYGGQFLIADETSNGRDRSSYVLRCDTNLTTCNIITDELAQPRYISIFNFVNY